VHHYAGDLLDILHVAWLFPMTSGELAAWIQGAGTLAAVIVTLWLTFRETRSRRRDELRRTASACGGWPTRRNQYRGLGFRYGELHAEIRNDGLVAAWKVTAYISDKKANALTLTRTIDVIIPMGDVWRPQWWVDPENRAMTESEIFLTFEYSLSGLRWRQTAQQLVLLGEDKTPVMPMWLRNLSAAWNAVEANQLQNISGFVNEALLAWIDLHSNQPRSTESSDYTRRIDALPLSVELKEDLHEQVVSAIVGNQVMNQWNIIKTETLLESLNDQLRVH
jgi:hypothetical protein